MMYEILHNFRLNFTVSDDAMSLLSPAAGPEFDGCLLDAYCEDEGFALAKLEEIEWRLIKRGTTALVAACHSWPDSSSSITSSCY